MAKPYKAMLKKTGSAARGRRGAKSHSRQDYHGMNIASLQYQIFEAANYSVSKVDYYLNVTRFFCDLVACDSVELCICEGLRYFLGCEFIRSPKRFINTRILAAKKTGSGCLVPEIPEDPLLQIVMEEVVGRGSDFLLPRITKGGSFWTNDMKTTMTLAKKGGDPGKKTRYSFKEGPRSLLAVPVAMNGTSIGSILFKSSKRNFFTGRKIASIEDAARSFQIALAYYITREGLKERVKELTCLYTIARFADQRDRPIGAVMKKIVESLPAAWQFPEVASARITLNDHLYATPHFEDVVQKQSVDIEVEGQKRGMVEIGYWMKKPEFDEGPFLQEERRLLDTVAKEIALIVQQRHADEARANLQEQLRHADRLATIGQLAAGVAHELNEPLGNILGFAQLIQKTASLPDQVRKDVDKIVTASLLAREIIRKLMFFGRQMPPKKMKINLNKTVEDGLHFLKSRCDKSGVRLDLCLCDELPDITADPSQMYQVLVNLVVNAIQAMPQGGTLQVKTARVKDRVSIVVSDNGIGMSREVMNQVFIPFFTTKGLDQGTGLGLPVVHGIVTAHGGTIRVESEVGKGSAFEVLLPLNPPPQTDEREKGDG